MTLDQLHLFLLTTGATPALDPAPGWFNFLMGWGPILIIVVVMWFVLFAPQRRERKQREAMLAALKKNDRVQTIGGELGSVLQVEDERVLLKVDESSNTKIWYVRGAIQRVLSDEKKPNA